MTPRMRHASVACPARPNAFATAVWLLVATAVSSQTLEELNNDGTDTDHVLTYGMGYYQHRYSPLTQVNKQTVKRLVPVWNVSLSSNYGEQAQPLVYRGVMYVTNAEYAVAIDVDTGKQRWRTPVDWDPATPRVVCCGVTNKGPALYHGKVFRGTLDAFVVALDQKTGQQIWKQKAAEWQEGYSITGAPLVANGVLITGISGAEFGTRGFLDGWDPDTGQHVWRLYTIHGPGEPGHETWPPGDAYLHGGGSTWITGSYDPELDFVYWGTGDAGPWNPATRPGDNLYTASVLAIRPKTGQLVWHYQFTPNEMYDWDATWERSMGRCTSTWPPAGRWNPGCRRRYTLARKLSCGPANGERRTGRTPPSMRKLGCSMPTPCTSCAVTALCPSSTSPASATFDLRTFPRDQKRRFINAVTHGKNNMPPWGDLPTPEDIEALWAYVMAGEPR
jgi:glucose dehydrogenase